MTAPERWTLDAGDAGVARLEIPADALRERRFEIAVTMTVKVPPAGSPWHALRIECDGRLQWQRRIASHPGSEDGLEYRFRSSVPVGRALRVLVRADCGSGARRWRLRVEADEV